MSVRRRGSRRGEKNPPSHAASSRCMSRGRVLACCFWWLSRGIVGEAHNPGGIQLVDPRCSPVEPCVGLRTNVCNSYIRAQWDIRLERPRNFSPPPFPVAATSICSHLKLKLKWLLSDLDLSHLFFFRPVRHNHPSLLLSLLLFLTCSHVTLRFISFFLLATGPDSWMQACRCRFLHFLLDREVSPSYVNSKPLSLPPIHPPSPVAVPVNPTPVSFARHFCVRAPAPSLYEIQLSWPRIATDPAGS
jgi:hypothetical protein